MTLTFEIWTLRMTHRLVIVNTCAKLFENPFLHEEVMVQTKVRHTKTCQSNFGILNQKCDFDIKDMDLSLAHDIPSHQ